MKNWKSFLLVMLVVLSIPATAQVVTGQTDSLELDGAKFQLVPWDTMVMRPGDEAKVGKKCETSKKDFFHNTVTCTWEKTINATESGLVESGGKQSEYIEMRWAVVFPFIPFSLMLLAIIAFGIKDYEYSKGFSILATLVTIMIGLIAGTLTDIRMIVSIILSLVAVYFAIYSQRGKIIFYVTAVAYIFSMIWFCSSVIII